MKCMYCGCDPETIVLLPIKRKDGALDSFACLPCAEKSGAYCEVHSSPHTGFLGDDSTACLYCIEEEVQSAKGMPVKIEEMYELIHRALSAGEWARLHEGVELSCAITGDTEPESVLRFIVTRAHRLHRDSDDVLAQILAERSASLILPVSLF